MQITVERDICIAGGHCVLEAPAVFDQDEEDGQVLLLNPTPAEGERAAVEEAALLCPARAITVTD